MAIPTPEPGLVISYSYVWDHEARGGQEEGRKDRPCVIALAVERQQDGETLVTVLIASLLCESIPTLRRPWMPPPGRTPREISPPARGDSARPAGWPWAGRR